ncbi:MAG: secondary thiamine-phosphate synthase enzyme YjbQ [Candidatus Hadarchaeales archaeon]
MKTWYKEIAFSTNKQREVVDLTQQVIHATRESGIRNGILVLQLPHATAALAMNEGEEGLKQDILEKLDNLIPVKGKYQHDRIDTNAHAHLKSVLLGSSAVLPIVDGSIVRGTWQNILVIEQDGPRRRRLAIFLMGE